MFDITCPHCSTRRLIFPGQVRGLVNDARGIHVTVECWCGGRSTFLTGRAARPEAVAAVA